MGGAFGGAGNGGGAAGQCGEAYVENNYQPSSASPSPTFFAGVNTKTPGKGSDGGKGADGVLLIYY